MYIAHVKTEDGAQQLVLDHLKEVGDIAAVFARKINAESAGRLIGLLHDFGKYSQEFQQYIQSATGLIEQDDELYVDSVLLKGKIDHSTAGAHWVWKKLSKYGSAGQGELCGQILSLCIASHHSGLIDCFGIDDRPVFSDRMKKSDDKVHLNECKLNADDEILEEIERLANVDLIKEMLGDLRKFINFDDPTMVDYFNLGFFTRFLFSCLIDADRLSSAEFEDEARFDERLKNSRPVKWSVAINRLESHLSSLPIRNHVDYLRREISDNCKENSLKPKGIYTLTVPTGGGKTYASLRYALHHASQHDLERIIYVIPYTSIIEQNAEVIRGAVEDGGDSTPWVLEHHSSLEPEHQTWRSKLVTENWDAPIVLTTMVQLLETLFSGGTRGVRRLHQLANSVLIFDEIQTLPINCVHLFCNAMNFLSKQCSTSVVLCTATQPLLNDLRRPDKGQLDIPGENELAGDFVEHFRQLRRVDVRDITKPGGWSVDEVAEFAINQFREKNNCLVIVNTKSWAQDLYRRCVKELDVDSIFHLSTNQCPAHRKRLLDEVKLRLKNELPVLCISTQLIEAGVDIDFSSVIRFLAGLDSIAQAAGRCNRNGQMKGAGGKLVKGEVFVVNPNKETTGMLKDIEVGKEKAARVLNEVHDDMLSPSAITQYFRYYFFDRASDMDYRLKENNNHRDESLLNLLSSRKGSADFCGRRNKVPLMRQAFMEAGKQFKAIDAPTQAVIVPYGADGKKLIAELCSVAKEFDAHRYYQLLRQAQKYSVNTFPNVWLQLQREGAVHEIQEGHGIYYLKENYYSDNFGLTSAEVSHASTFVL